MNVNLYFDISPPEDTLKKTYAEVVNIALSLPVIPLLWTVYAYLVIDFKPLFSSILEIL